MCLSKHVEACFSKCKCYIRSQIKPSQIMNCNKFPEICAQDCVHQINFENKQNIKDLMKQILNSILLIFMFEYAWICGNVPESAWMAFVLFSHCNSCILDCVTTYFNVYTKWEVIAWRIVKLFSWRDKTDFFL